MSSQVQAMLAKARQKSDFDAVTQHYGCCAEQIEEIREIANRDKKAARDYFAWEANKIREGRA